MHDSDLPDDSGTSLRRSILARVSGGVAWLLAGNLTWRGLSMIATLGIARFLGPVQFGEFILVLATIRIFSSAAGFRLGTTATKYVAQLRLSDPARASRVLSLTLRLSTAICLVFAFAAVLAAPHLARNSLQKPELSFALMVGALLVFFLISSNVRQHALVGFERFRESAIVNMVRGAVPLLAALPLAHFFGVEGAVGGMVVTAACALVLVSHFLTRASDDHGFPRPVSLRDAWSESPVLGRFALPGVLSAVLVTATAWWVRVLLSRQADGGLELGMLSAADQWRLLILFLPAVLERVMLPVLSKAHGTSTSTYREASSLQLEMIGTVTLPAAILLMSFPGPLAALFGKAFEDAAAVIPVVSLAVFLFALNQAFKQNFDSAGRRWLHLSLIISWALAYALAAFAWVPTQGALGAAWSLVIAEGVLLALQSVVIESVLAPGVLRRNLRLLGFSTITIGGSLLLPSPHGWDIPLRIGLLIVASLPLTFTLARSGISATLSPRTLKGSPDD